VSYGEFLPRDESKPGYFEALGTEQDHEFPNGLNNSLWHYWRDNSDPNLPWYGEKIAP
jgi:hypothetical protein